MKARSSLVFATLLLLVLNIYPTLGELKLVIQFNRHGARGPIYDLPDREYWNQFGQLTPVGMRQLYLLGAQLRQRYIIDQKFLPEKYNPDVIFVRSTAVNRTIMSAMSLLYGLYPIGTGPDLPEGYPKERAVPPINFQVDIESLGDNALPNKFQPVPVHMTKINKDYELRAYDADVCPKATELAEKTYNSDDFKKIDAAFKDLYPELANAFGIPVEKVNPFMGQQMMDNLLVDYMADKPLKIAYKSDLWKKLYMLYNIMMIYSPYASEEQQNLFTTKLYADILKYITAAQKGSPLKWVTYSAHDTTLNLVIAQLKVTGWSCLLSNYLEGRYDYFYGCPFVSLFSSSIILEVHSDDKGAWFLRFFYEDKQYAVAGLGDIPLEKFKEIVAASAVANFDEACLGPPTPTNNGGIPTWKIATLTILGVAVLGLAGVVGYLVYSLKKRDSERERLA